MISPTVGDSLSAVLIPVVVGLVCGTPSSRLFYLDPLYRTYWINEFGTYFYPLIFIDTLHVMGLDSQIHVADRGLKGRKRSVRISGVIWVSYLGVLRGMR